MFVQSSPTLTMLQFPIRRKLVFDMGLIFKETLFFLITDYFCDEDPTCGDRQIFPVNHCLLLKICPFFLVLIFICYIEYTFGYILLLSPLQ